MLDNKSRESKNNDFRDFSVYGNVVGACQNRLSAFPKSFGFFFRFTEMSECIGFLSLKCSYDTFLYFVTGHQSELHHLLRFE